MCQYEFVPGPLFEIQISIETIFHLEKEMVHIWYHTGRGIERSFELQTWHFYCVLNNKVFLRLLVNPPLAIHFLTFTFCTSDQRSCLATGQGLV